ncbi:MAG: hypothetical protein ACQEUB_09135, partial [Thermodesulfobacteriota bacterium]
MTSKYQALDHLAQAICGHILPSFELDKDLLHFAQSTLGLGSAQELCTALAEADSDPCPELECLLELVLSPGLDQRVNLEPILQDLSVHKMAREEDDDQLVQALMRLCPQAHIHFPDGSRVHLDVNREQMQGIVRRLRIQNFAPSVLKRAVDDHVPTSWQPWVLVQLRLAASPLTGARADFLARVLRHIPVSSSLFCQYFQFSLSFVQECADDQDMAQALQAKKEHLEHSLDRAAFLERQRSSQAMETLLMQRLPMLSIDTSEAREKIQIINDLSLALYGQVPAG